MFRVIALATFVATGSALAGGLDPDSLESGDQPQRAQDQREIDAVLERMNRDFALQLQLERQREDVKQQNDHTRHLLNAQNGMGDD